MKILVIGSGGREHALVWKLRQSSKVTEVIAAPGNAGISRLAQCLDISADNIDKLVDFARESKVDLVIPGPEAPLALGIADKLKAVGIPVFGPTANAAQLESSKVFAKKFCSRHSIPTAAYSVCKNASGVMQSVQSRSFKCVIKADGLAAGKGVFVCRDEQAVTAAIDVIFTQKSFGQAASRVIVEDLLSGEEASILVLVDGTHYTILESCQDHKAAFDNDEGPNTGGMGAYSPAPIITPTLRKTIDETIIQPAVSGMKAEGNPFVGVLYAGLMIDQSVPYVLEFNVRFGDPETQPLLTRLESDLAEMLMDCAMGRLDYNRKILWSPNTAVCVVMASGGYPGSYEKGFVIHGLDQLSSSGNVEVFHSGTAIDSGGRIVTAGGRVLGVTASAPTVKEACLSVYQSVKKIDFKNCHYRKDIAHRALYREADGGNR